jgi:hypothetical protein
VPHLAGEAPAHVAFAYCFGYIRALMQTLGVTAASPA